MLAHRRMYYINHDRFLIVDGKIGRITRHLYTNLPLPKKDDTIVALRGSAFPVHLHAIGDQFEFVSMVEFLNTHGVGDTWLGSHCMKLFRVDPMAIQ